MQVKRIPGGALRILISDRELARFGANFSSLRERDPRTEIIMRRILGAVCGKAGFPPRTVITVEAVPTDGGCLLLVTPHPADKPDTRSVYIFAITDIENLLLLAAQCGRLAVEPTILSTSLYVYRDSYRLLLYGDTIPPSLLETVAEFSTPVDGGAVEAAMIGEHGRAVFVGDALQQLAKR